MNKSQNSIRTTGRFIPEAGFKAFLEYRDMDKLAVASTVHSNLAISMEDLACSGSDLAVITSLSADILIYGGFREKVGISQQLDDFEAVAAQWGASVWGLVEPEQPDYAAREDFRDRLAKKGLFPIPVFNPLSDPEEAFYELCSKNSRVAIGNLRGEKDEYVCKKILATAAKRCPAGTWLHVIGIQPVELLLWYPPNSTSCEGELKKIDGGALTKNFKWQAVTTSAQEMEEAVRVAASHFHFEELAISRHSERFE